MSHLGKRRRAETDDERYIRIMKLHELDPANESDLAVFVMSPMMMRAVQAAKEPQFTEPLLIKLFRMWQTTPSINLVQEYADLLTILYSACHLVDGEISVHYGRCDEDFETEHESEWPADGCVCAKHHGILDCHVLHRPHYERALSRVTSAEIVECGVLPRELANMVAEFVHCLPHTDHLWSCYAWPGCANLDCFHAPPRPVGMPLPS